MQNKIGFLREPDLWIGFWRKPLSPKRSIIDPDFLRIISTLFHSIGSLLNRMVRLKSLNNGH